MLWLWPDARKVEINNYLNGRYGGYFSHTHNPMGKSVGKIKISICTLCGLFINANPSLDVACKPLAFCY
jgi:hypothetical protein